MKRCDSPDGDLGQELVVDCGYTKVIACRVGALGSSLVRAAKPRDFSRVKRDKPPPDESATDSYIPRFPQGKIREFTLKELEMATENFSRKRVLGRGGFGEVFKGILWDGAAVVVKVLAKDSGQGFEQFQAEMRASSAIMSVPHPNLVPAIGYHSSCKGKKAKAMIVYPFMSNGDVGCYLGDCQPPRTRLDWPTRKRIALGIARGISSLHELGIVHCDIKPSNIMLDDEFNAHVGDLGLAKSMGLPCISYYAMRFHEDDDGYISDSIRICGTFGYMAPEYIRQGQFSRKSDVYAFGVTLLQLVTGNPTFHETKKGMCLSILSLEEQLSKNEEDLTRHMHPSLLGMYDESEAIELIQLGLVCTHYDPEKRPLMPEVIDMMEGSSATLKQRWGNYDCSWRDRQLSADYPREISFTTIDSEISADSSWTIFTYVGTHGSGSINDEVEVRSAVEFDINEEEPEENRDDGNKLQRADDFSSSKDIVEVDPNEEGYSKQLNSQADRQEGQSDEVATKLKEVIGQMRAIELSHQAAMEEMYQKQTAIMHSMIKMQEQYIQKVNEIQSQIDQLNEVSQKL